MEQQMTIIDWRAFWREFDKRSDKFQNQAWDGRNGLKALFRRMLRTHGVVFTDTRWLMINKRFKKWFENSHPYRDWEQQKRWLRENVKRAIERPLARVKR